MSVLWLLTGTASARPVIMILGDSLSAAPGVPHDQNWASLLQKRLDQNGHRYSVVNASVSGDTTLAGLSRLPAALKAHRPAIIIIELGGNDGLRGLPLTQMQNNLTKMITLAKSSGAKVLLCGVRIPPNLGPDYVSKFLEVYFTTAQQNNVPLVPYILKNVATNKSLMQNDGIHPNRQGQPYVLENVWEQLKLLI